MEIFETGEEIIEAIYTCKDRKEARSALAVVVKFATHDKSIVKDDSLKPGLANKVMLSMLMLAVKGMGEPKGGE